MATPEAIKNAKIHDRERQQLERIGVRDVVASGRTMRVSILKGFDRGQIAFDEEINTATLRLNEALRGGLVAAHLTGMVRSVRVTEEHLRKTSTSKQLGIYDKATEFAQGRLALTKADLAAILQKYAGHAKTVTGQFKTDLGVALSTSVARSVEMGETKQQGKARIRRAMTGVTGEVTSPHQAETLYRTQVNMAYSAGRWEVAQDPDVQDILWGFEYVDIDDDRVRAAHELLDGTKLPKDDPAWSSIWTPNGFNCRCTTIEIFDTDIPTANQIGLPEPKLMDGILVKPEPDPGFDFNPGEAFGGSIGPRKIKPIQKAKGQEKEKAKKERKKKPVTAPAPVPTATTGIKNKSKLEKSLRGEEIRIVDSDVEVGSIWDNDGNQIWTRRGTRNGIKMTGKDVSDLIESGKGAVITHNHPDAAHSLSPQDFGLLFDRSRSDALNLRQMRATGRLVDGRRVTYEMNRLDPTKRNRKRILQLEKEYDKRVDTLSNSTIREIRRKNKRLPDESARDWLERSKDQLGDVNRVYEDTTHRAWVELAKENPDLFSYRRRIFDDG